MERYCLGGAGQESGWVDDTLLSSRLSVSLFSSLSLPSFTTSKYPQFHNTQTPTSPLIAIMDPQPGDQAQQPPPPTLTHPRFTLELEFVSSLANPYYLSHLAVNYPNLLGINKSGDDNDTNDSGDPDAQAFAAYLAYLYSYWKTPEYAQFLTHPGATLRALRLLQEDTFRRDIIRPQVIEGLAGTGIENEQGGTEANNPGEAEGEQTKGTADQQDGSSKT
ncbi:conserved hypothetical protein [Aspergillus terreus NIH2624]|nr:uncharacterized protein ATEG_04027 [Aspergillus terreus NIH2624]EAU35829.1 conserved hypothetical protein [Aspergillus terreus NIH2624]